MTYSEEHLSRQGVQRLRLAPEAAFPEPAGSPEPVRAGHMGVTGHHQPAGLNVVENPAATFPQLHSRPLRK